MAAVAAVLHVLNISEHCVLQNITIMLLSLQFTKPCVRVGCDQRSYHHHITTAAKPLRSLQRPQKARSSVVRSIPASGPGGSVSQNVAPQGQVSSEIIVNMKQKIGEALETDKVQVTDVYGDGRHVAIDVVSPLFEGKNSIARQRMVYKAIWLELQETVHAVDAMTCKTPTE